MKGKRKRGESAFKECLKGNDCLKESAQHCQMFLASGLGFKGGLQCRMVQKTLTLQTNKKKPGPVEMAEEKEKRKRKVPKVTPSFNSKLIQLKS